ncbi:sigma-54-dependent transcriptional regulator [Pseudorhodoplanes sp.]|uniref:sigma-54-dependent transcriptional regulator n=1 Tax=Pseudorhodoplanes sp. TaxID=1934341 RepID=UPI003D0E119E
MPERILVVDDDPVQRRLLENMVRKFGYEAVLAEGGDQAARILSGDEAERIDCVILDLVMPDLDGFGLLARMRSDELAIPVIVQTAHGGIDNVISAMRAGAADFVVKPASPERLQVSLKNALTQSALAGELQRMKRSRSGTLSFRDIITRSPAMGAVLRQAQKASASTIPVLIEGESGVGKEMIARAIHGSGERRARPFVAVNCGAIPDNLVESILFGHERGAFTGATERHVGKFAEANGGTLFLDEVGELPLAAQVKLLRALQEGEVEPVGARKSMLVDVRVISATNRNLIADVKSGRFREDLFYRLHVFPLSVPPLRERIEDLPELVRHFLVRFCAEEGKSVKVVSGDAMVLLRDARWPGNVRQLENAVFRAVVLAEGEEIGPNEFPQIAARDAELGAPASLVPNGDENRLGEQALVVETPRFSADRLGLLDGESQLRPLDELEAEIIRFAIAHYRGQMSEVARRLRIGRSTLYRKLEGLQLSDQNRHPTGHPVAVAVE